MFCSRPDFTLSGTLHDPANSGGSGSFVVPPQDDTYLLRGGHVSVFKAEGVAPLTQGMCHPEEERRRIRFPRLLAGSCKVPERVKSGREQNISIRGAHQSSGQSDAVAGAGPRGGGIGVL